MTRSAPIRNESAGDRELRMILTRTVRRRLKTSDLPPMPDERFDDLATEIVDAVIAELGLSAGKRFVDDNDESKPVVVFRPVSGHLGLGSSLPVQNRD